MSKNEMRKILFFTIKRSSSNMRKQKMIQLQNSLTNAVNCIRFFKNSERWMIKQFAQSLITIAYFHDSVANRESCTIISQLQLQQSENYSYTSPPQQQTLNLTSSLSPKNLRHFRLRIIMNWSEIHLICMISE